MHITVIAKAPVPGRVKTRLCPPCTPQQASDVAAAALADTLDAVAAVAAGVGMRPTLLLDGDRPDWVSDEYDVVAQCSGDLSARLAHGFAVLGRGVIVGMDTPAAIRHLPGAVEAVARGDDALGLAIDGGYWVIGLASVDAQVFAGIEMSTENTGAQQWRRLRSLGRSVTMLPSARDLDTFDDLVAVACSSGGGRLGIESRRVVGAARSSGVSGVLVSTSADSRTMC